MICAGNWKMNKNPLEAADFVKDFRQSVAPNEEGDFVLFPPAICLMMVQEQLKGCKVGWGAQNCHWQNSGAFTGETSPEVLAQMGATHVLVGHSERRHLFGESDEMIARKLKTVQLQGLTPILCVGETQNERDDGKTELILESQLRGGLCYTDFQKPLWIAYEPVWAIGTGRVATPDQANFAHQFIRNWLTNLNPALKTTSILYGGSVKPDNAAELARQPDVDGFLVGGASLDVKSFVAIYRAALKATKPV